MDPTLFPWLQQGDMGAMQNPHGSNPFNPVGVPGAGLPGTGQQMTGTPSDPLQFMNFLMGSKPAAAPIGAAPGPMGV